MSSNKNSYPIPDGYKEIEFQTEHHIDHIGNFAAFLGQFLT